MKTSLICLLLLAAVVCAAPQAGEMPGEKRAGMAKKMREKMSEKRKEIAKKMQEMTKENGEEMAEEKRKEAENAEAAAKFDGEAESRIYPTCSGGCYGPLGEVGCYYDECYYDDDIINYDLIYDYDYGSRYDHIICACCSDVNAPYCYYK